MKKSILIVIVIAFLGVSVQTNGQACNDVPVINSFTPNTGFIGSTVTIFGANFDSNTITNNVVYFGSTKADVLSATFGKLEVTVPVGASTAPISVTNQCELTAYSKVAFNGIFCPTPLNSQTYNNRAFDLTGVYGAYNMISQDLDLDGKPEVISSSNGGGLTIAVNNSTPGNLSFTKINRNGGGQSIYAADFDGDGLKDLVSRFYVNRNTSTGPGNVSFANPIRIPDVSGYQIAAGDFNNDGKIDIIGSYSNNIYIAFNTSTGPGHIAFGARQLVATTGHCTGIQVADIDGDGKTDFIASQGPYNRAVSIRNTTTTGSMTRSFEAPEYWSSGGSYPYRCGVADFDKDGKIDFTSCNYSGSTNTAIWRNISTVGDIKFAPTVNLPAPRNNYRIGVGDVDGDGYPDIVTKSLGINVFSVYKNTSTGPGTPTFAPRIDYTSSWQNEVSGIVIGDLDGDFVPDIATSGISSNRIIFHRNVSAQVDTDPPTASCKNITVALDPQGSVTITPSMVDNGSSDACGLDRLELSKTTFTCNDIGENQVTLTAIDNGGNQTSCTAIVNVQPAAIIVAGQTTVCQGGVINMNANVGDSYQWKKDGQIIVGAINQSYQATESGSYTVTVTNSGGCSGESLPTIATVNNNPTVAVSPSGTTYICPPNGNATLTASQSSIYQWMKNGVDIPNATLQTYNATTVGIYSVRVIDLFGCSAVSDDIIVGVNPPEIDVIGSGNYGNILPNQNYTKTFTISNSGISSLDINSISISGADSQFFTIVNAPSSIAANSSANVDVVFNAPNITTYSSVMTILSNDCDEGTITIPLNAEITCLAASFMTIPNDIEINTESGNCSTSTRYTVETIGNPSPVLTYELTGATTDSGSGDGSGSLFNIGTTTVTLNLQNACGDVTTSFNVTVIDEEPPVILNLPSDIIVSATDTSCETPVTWTSPLAFDNCLVLLTSTHEPGDVFSVGTTAVTYTATDTSGNTITESFNITVTPIELSMSLSSPLIGIANTSCHDASDASIEATINGGCEPYSYEWSNGATDEDINNLEAGTYTLTVTDANGSSISESITLTEPDLLETFIDSPATISLPTCAFDATHLLFGYPGNNTTSVTLNSNTYGGNGDYSYSWSPSINLDNPNSPNPVFSPTMDSAGCNVHEFTLTVTDSFGCVTTESVTINAVHVGVVETVGKGKNQKKVHKVLICHKGKKTISVDYHAIPAHIAHGDCLGSCDGCSSVSRKTSSNEETHTDINIFPNPARGVFEVELGHNTNDTEVQLFDPSGKLIEQNVIRANSSSIKMGNPDLSSGVYILKVNSEDGITTHKVMMRK